MKKSKRAKVSEGEDGVDMISNLPDDILHLIISRIPTTEEVIRTSILSTRWRNLWTSIPSVDIDCYRGLNPYKEFIKDKFKDFVYWVLLNKPLHLDSFRLWCADCFDMSTIRHWIHAVVMRKVKLHDLMFCPWHESVTIELPQCLVTCGSLEVLRLCLMGFPLSLPKFTGFPALRVLELKEVELFNNKLVKYILKNCPLLEDLSLIDCGAWSFVISSPKLKKLRIETRQLVSVDEDDDDDDDWRMCLTLKISCPKLEFLKLIGYVAMEFLFKNLCSMKEAVIHPEYLFELEPPPFDFFARMSHVEVLSINLYCIRACFSPEEDDPISLPNLKNLELTIDGMDMYVLIPFLKCLPDLESLHLIFPKDIYGLHKWNQKVAAKMSIVTRHLKKVEFLGFDEDKAKLAVARALLEHGNELKEMVFSWDNEAEFHERSKETMKEVSKFHKASSTVKLTVVIKPIKANL